MAFLLLLTVMTVIVGILISIRRLNIQQQQQLLSQLAGSRNGLVQKKALTYPTLSLPHHTSSMILFPTSHTVSVNVPLNISRDFVFSLYHGSSNPYNDRILDTFHSECAEFENAFTIEGKDEYCMRALLTSQIQEQLLTRFVTLGEECSMSITRQRFGARLSPPPNTTRHYEQFLEIVRICLERVHACTTVQSIIFGHPAIERQVSDRTVWNPHISESTVPMLTLQQVLIDTETYVPHQVERFLTYAVNHIGQTYLKQCVEVHIYGEGRQLHTNVKNALTNLYRSVRVHDHKCITPITTLLNS